MTKAAAPFASGADADDDGDHDRDQDDRTRPLQAVKPIKRKQPAADPLPGFTDRDAAPNTARPTTTVSIPLSRIADSAVATLPAMPDADDPIAPPSMPPRRAATAELAGDGQRTDLQDQRDDLGGHHHDGGQAQRGLRVGPDVGDRPVEDVGQAQRPQRDDARLEGRRERRRRVTRRRIARAADSPAVGNRFARRRIAGYGWRGR